MHKHKMLHLALANILTSTCFNNVDEGNDCIYFIKLYFKVFKF